MPLHLLKHNSMKPIHVFCITLLNSALLWAPHTPLHAEDTPVPTSWTEDFADEAVFKKNWEKYDALVPPYQDKTKRFWQLEDGMLRGNAYLGVHPVGIMHKINGTDVRLKLRFKLGAGAGFYANFNGRGNGSNTIDPQTDIRFRRASMHLNASGLQIYDDRYVPPPEGVAYVKGMDLSKGNMSGVKLSLTENEWHELILDIVGKEVTVQIDGKQVASHLTHTGDEAKMSTGVSVSNDGKSETAEAWIDDLSFEPLKKE